MKTKKITLILLSLFMMVSSAWATKTYVDLSTMQSNGTTSVWDNASKSLVWSTTGGGATVQIPGLTGDLSDYETIVLETADLVSSPFRCVIKVALSGGGNKDYEWAMYSAGTKNLSLGTGTGFKNNGVEITKEELKNVISVSIGGTWASSGSLTINEIYLVKPFALTFGSDGIAHISASDLDVSNNNITINPATGEINATGEGDIYVALPNVNFSGVSRIEVTHDGDICSTMSIHDSNGAFQTWYGSRYGADFADYRSKASQVTKLSWHVNKAGTMTISDIKITSAFINGSKAFALPTGATDVKTLWNTISYPQTFAVQGAYWGNNGTSTTNFVGDGTDDYVAFVVTEGSTQGLSLRVWVTDGSITKTLFAYPIAEAATVENWETSYKIKTPGVYVAKITGYKMSGIKAGNDYGASPIVVALAYTCKGTSPVDCDMENYSLSLVGCGLLADNAKDILADASATLIDATGVTGTGVELTSANPNCIIKANAGVLSNANNVMVGTTIASLSLTDGNAFAVPAGATATSATYSRTVAGTYGTICLPYAVESDENVQFFTLGANDGETLTIEEAESVAAGTPAIFKKLGENDMTFTGSGALAAATDGSASTGTVMTMKGAYTQKVLTENLGNYYYISNGEVCQATESLTINPFRAYMEASSNAGARIRLAEADVTAINALFNADNSDVKVEAIYGANGAAKNEIGKGLNIVKLSNGTVKKVMVK